MSASITRQNGCVILRPAGPRIGRLFLAANREALQAELTAGAPVILDTSNVEVIDGAGLGALIAILRLCDPEHEFLLSNVPGSLSRALEQAGVAELFPVFANLPAALEFAMPLLRLQRAVSQDAEPVEVIGQPLSLTRTSHQVPCP